MPLRSRTLPAGFIAPCLPTNAPHPPSGPMWLHEIKHDGFRVIARKNGNVGKDFGTVPRRTNPVAWW
jgi:ATP-dependent DNA ligase